MSSIRVLVVDDHAMFRRGLTDLLAEEADIEVVGEAGDSREAVRQVEALRPDLVCMDVNMPGSDGIATTAAVCERWPESKVLMLTVSEDPVTLFRSMAAGASGYVVKNAPPSQVLESVRQAAQGWVAIAPAVAPLFLQTLSGGQGAPRGTVEGVGRTARTELSRREVEVLRFVTRAYTNAEIAVGLGVSLDTVKSHVRSILSKLRVHSKREALQRARELGMLEVDEDRGG